MSVEVVHLLHVHAARGVVMAGVAVAALKTDLVALLAQVAPDALVRVAVI